MGEKTYMWVHDITILSAISSRPCDHGDVIFGSKDMRWCGICYKIVMLLPNIDMQP